jgi:hypothetical protein
MKDKKKTLKTAREKKQTAYQDIQFCLKAEFSTSSF